MRADPAHRSGPRGAPLVSTGTTGGARGQTTAAGCPAGLDWLDRRGIDWLDRRGIDWLDRRGLDWLDRRA